ncbi:unnamed protein product [Caretta caretta]
MDFEAPATSTAFRKRVCGKVLPFQGEMGLFTQIKTISIIKVRQKARGQPLRRTHCFSFSCTAGEATWKDEQPVIFLFGFSNSSFSMTPLNHLCLLVESLGADQYLPTEATGIGVE